MGATDDCVSISGKEEKLYYFTDKQNQYKSDKSKLPLVDDLCSTNLPLIFLFVQVVKHTCFMERAVFQYFSKIVCT